MRAKAQGKGTLKTSAQQKVETKTEGGRAGISVIGIGGGGLHTATERQSSNVSRIKFTVPVILPTEAAR